MEHPRTHDRTTLGSANHTGGLAMPKQRMPSHTLGWCAEPDRLQLLRRRATRFPASNLSAVLSVTQTPRDPAQRQPCSVVDLSATGVLLRTRGYIHTDRPCVVSLKDLGGTIRSLAGVVRWCDYESDRGHAIGVRFDDNTDPYLFIPESIIDATIEAETRLDDRPAGSVLIATNADLRNVLLDELGKINVATSSAASSAQALQAFLAEPIDALVTDRTLGTAGEGGELAQAWRQRGFTGPVVLVGQRTDSELASIASRLNATDVVRSPWKGERLINAVRDALNAYPLRSSKAEVYSTVEAVYGTPDPVRAFITRAQALADHAIEAQVGTDPDALDEVLRELESGAVEAGFAHYAALIAGTRSRFGASGRDCFSAFDEIRRISGYIPRLTCRADRIDA